MGKYILALDQGTSSSRAMLLNADGDILAVEQLEFKQYYPQPGWVEQDPMEIWESQLKVTQKLLQQNHIDAREIHALGITNQRETTLVWDKLTGKPVYNAIVWQDKRTTGFCNELVQEGWGPYAAKNTGLVIDSYFSGTKIHWILNHVAGAKEKAAKGELLFGTVDTWLVWNLTGGKLHVTDYTNASRTLLFNITSLEWDEELLARLQVPHSLLPQVVESSAVIGATTAALFGAEIPIAGIAGDQQSALFGQAGFEPGLAKNTYGTGCFILMNTGSKQVISDHGLLTTLTCGTKADQPRYALEGSVFIAGAAIKWLRDALKLVKNAGETQQIAEALTDTQGVYVVPAFTGLGAPYWNMNARGGIFGLTLGITDKHIVKATLESLAYQSNDVLKAMEKDAGVPIQSLNVDGGASANNYLMQFQSNLTNARVIRPKNIETTALGAAFLAGLASGFWKDRADIARIRKIDREFEPKMEAETRDKLCAGWQKAVKRTLDWEEGLMDTN
ncbi:MAG: glycerol kinase [Bacteroidetes bacterium HGW-Bacteroidetes-4]|jgi:glycerol kinase|nr:MAG: glycerol kinase [Bacteroidetes bacterium HGW-Bacteroidetes-4]